MEGTQIVRNSTIISLIIQILTGIIGGTALFVPLEQKDTILGDVLQLELLVQTVELGFYFAFLYVTDLASITAIRYFDWILSTPVMLLTMSAYFSYESLNETATKVTTTNIKDFFAKNERSLYAIFYFNFLMLLAGFLGELGYVTRGFAFVYGFFALLLSFGIMYSSFVLTNGFLMALFAIISISWSGYGIAFLLDPVSKNVAYTILDIVAKNFFGLYLGFKIFQVRA